MLMLVSFFIFYAHNELYNSEILLDDRVRQWFILIYVVSLVSPYGFTMFFYV